MSPSGVAGECADSGSAISEHPITNYSDPSQRLSVSSKSLRMRLYSSAQLVSSVKP
jgi:hypothetical protein